MTVPSQADLTPEQVVVQYGQYLNQQQIDAIVEIYDENAEIIPDQLSSLKGHDAIVEFYQQTFQSIKIEGELKIVSCDIWQDIAIVRCEESASVKDLKTGLTTKNYFREMFVLILRANRWLIYKYMFSQNDQQAEQHHPIENNPDWVFEFKKQPTLWAVLNN